MPVASTTEQPASQHRSSDCLPSIQARLIDVGLIYKGLFARRDDDRTVFGVIYGRFSRDYAQTIEAAGKGFPTYASLIEGGHRFQLSKFAFLQPDIQWVINPSGTGQIPNALAMAQRWA